MSSQSYSVWFQNSAPKANKQAKMSDYLPNDLLTKILTFLPAKSLVRFTCVCKSWRSLITDFITTHLNQTKLSNKSNSINNRLFLFRYCPKIPDIERISLHIDNDTFDVLEKLDSPFQSSISDFHVYGSCNGLIFLSNDLLQTERSTLLLWNPSIKKSLTLPRPRHMHQKHYQAFGFGFDSRTNDYKVVRLVYLGSNQGNVSPKVEVYKLSTRSWETITATFDPPCFAYCNHLGETFIKGAVHWRVFKKGINFLIMSFDMGDQEFSEIMPPANLDRKFFFEIAVCGEWLSLFDIDDDKYFSLWAMKEYGVVESWTKLYFFDLKAGNLNRPLGFRNNGELILKLSDEKFVSYDSKTQQFKYLNTYACRKFCFCLCPLRFYANPYVESLVLLGDSNRLGSGLLKEARKKKK